MENVLLKTDILKYKNIDNASIREQTAIQIFEKYLNGERSPLQVNLDAITLQETVALIDRKYFEKDLLDICEKAVMFNLLTDTYRRFIETKEYKLFKDE